MQDRDVTLRFPDASGRTLAEFLSAAPRGSVVELATGQFEGPIVIDKPLRLQGAGDLSRIVARHGRVIEVHLRADEHVELDSLLLEGGTATSGAGIWHDGGSLRLHNVHIQRCAASGGGGGAIHVVGGALDATVLRVNDVRGDRGGAIWVQNGARFQLRDSQIQGSEAQQGGALAIEGQALASLEAVTVKKARATTASGGQALFVAGAPGQRPTLRLRRVRLEDAPLGLPLFVDPEHPGDVSLTGCDMPRMVQSVVGVVDGGENHWR